MQNYSETAQKIIKWALKDADAYGNHISNIVRAIDSGELAVSVVSDLRHCMAEWNRS